MIGLESLRLLLTAAFGGASAFHLVRCLRPGGGHPHRGGGHRLSEALHLLMGLSMVVMIWPWGHVVPAPVWVAVFTLSTGWFAAGALRSAGRRLVLGFFATTMGAMVWMGATMPAQASPHHHSGPGEMAGMPGMGLGAAGHSLTYTAGISAALGGYLILASIWWVLRGLRISGLAGADNPPRPLSWTSLCHGLMSAGMGLALLAMA